MIARMEWASLGWRDGILLLVALAAIYLMVMLLKLVQVRRRHPVQAFNEPAVGETVDTVSPLRRRAEPEPEPDVLPVSVAAAVSAYAEEAAAHEPFAVPPAPSFEWSEVKELFGEEDVPAAPPVAVPRRSAGFGEHLSTHLARTDVEEEMQRMRDEMERMRKEMEDLRAARRVSPQYAEAVELLQQGMTAQDVADQLGISLAEAELVEALSRGRSNFDEGEDHGADGYARHAGQQRSTG